MPIAGCGSASSASTSASDIERPKCLNCRVRAGRTGRNGSRGLCNTCYAQVDVRRRFARGRQRKHATCLQCIRPAWARGFCASCYKHPDVQGMFLIDKHGGHGLKGLRPGPKTKRTFPPTDALPGTEEKIRVMRDRAAARLPIFHPHDAVRDDDAPRADRATRPGIATLLLSTSGVGT